MDDIPVPGMVQMTPSVTAEAFFGMNEIGKLEYLQDRLYKSVLHRRGANSNEHFMFQSNYKATMQMLNSQLAGHGKSALASIGSSSSGGGGGSTTGGAAATGPILDEYHKQIALSNEREEVELDNRVVLEGTRQANDAITMARQLTAGMTGKDKGVPLGEKLLASMPTASRIAREDAKAATVTVFRQQEFHVIKERDQRIRDLNRIMTGALGDVKKQFLRSSSYPRAIYAVAPYADARKELVEVKRRLTKVQKIAEGAAPRDQERKLEQRITLMEEQNTNQLALVRGLRERVKLLRLEIEQKESQAAAQQGGGSRFNSRATTPRDDGGLQTPSGSSSKVEGLRSAVGRPSIHRASIGGLPPAALPTPVTVPPRGDQCTAVVVELDSAVLLWENVPELMRSQAEIFANAVRTQAAFSGGFEVAAKDDRFFYVFSCVVDGCMFALQLQQRLLDCDWSPVLSDNAETPTELFPGSANQFLWRGLQARIGIDVGALPVVEPLLNNKTTFEGPAVDVAGYLQVLAIGGEILISSAVAELGKDLPGAPGVILEWGTSNYHKSRTRISRLIPTHLLARKERFQRNLNNSERSRAEEREEAAAEQVHPPANHVTLVSVFFPHADVIREEAPEVHARDTLQRCSHLVLRLAKAELGYISYQNTDTMRFVLAFDDTVGALRFAMELQKVLLTQEWHNSILAITQCSVIRLKGNVIFCGPRARIGIHTCASVPGKYVDPLTRKTVFRSNDSKFSSYFAAAAMDGETLISHQLVALVTRNLDELENPVCNYAADVSVPTADGLLRTFQMFPLLLRFRAAFVNREMRLKDESQELANRDVVAVVQNQVHLLQDKIEQKDSWVKRLDHQLGEKSLTIAQIRSFVLKQPFATVDVNERLTALDPSCGMVPPEYCCVAISFACSDELFDVEPTAMPGAVAHYNILLDEAMKACKGEELRRSPSQTARIVAFDEQHKALEFWLYVTRRSNNLDWPLKLDDLTGSSILMASELFPGLQSDQTVWRGLRPIGVLEPLLHSNKFNCITRQFDFLLECINDVADKLSQCSAGDLILSPKYALASRDRIERTCLEVTLAEYGPYFRITDNQQRFRNRAMTQAFPPRGVSVLPPLRKGKFLVVHVLCHDHPQTHKFTKDLTVFNEVVMKTIMEFEGHAVYTRDSEFLVTFSEPQKGVQFAVHIHSKLMQAMWTLEVRRVRDFREQTIENRIVARGLRARVGVHFIPNVAYTYDLFTGTESWFHSSMHVAFMLAGAAHSGETFLSEEAKNHLRRAQEEGLLDAFIEPCGRLVEIAATTDIYQAFPTNLRGRCALFIEEDRRKNNPEEIALAAQEDRVYQRRRERFAALIQRDAEFLDRCERSLNPFDDPVSKKTHHLHMHVKAQMHADRSRFLTCLGALEVLESVNMLAEDAFYLGHQDKGLPIHTHLMMYEMENGEMARNPVLDKYYASELLGADLLPEKPPELSGEGMVATETTRQSQRRQSVAPGMAIPTAAKNTSVSAAKEMARTTFIMPEDMAMVHIDVERFYNLLKLYGAKDRPGFLQEWTKTYAVIVPSNEQIAESIDERLLEMAGQCAVLGMDIADVDPKIVRRSIVANLSRAYQEICGIHSSILYGKQEKLSDAGDSPARSPLNSR